MFGLRCLRSRMATAPMHAPEEALPMELQRAAGILPAVANRLNFTAETPAARSLSARHRQECSGFLLIVISLWIVITLVHTLGTRVPPTFAANVIVFLVVTT